MVEFIDYGTIENKNVRLFTVSNDFLSFSVMQKGATLTHIFVPDKNGEKKDVLLGFDKLSDWVKKSDNQGVIAGPYANRIANAQFEIDGKTCQLVKNERGIQSLHSNFEYGNAIWDAEITGEFSVKFTYKHIDGFGGFPGNTETSVVYTLNGNKIVMEMKAKSDKKTVFNPTNHAYFNLSGFDGGDILSHELQIFAENYTPVDENSIPTGEIAPVCGTPFDFRKPKEIGKEIDEDVVQLKNTGGYDHNFCVDGEGLRIAARATDKKSGRTLTVYTTLPGVQFYAGNFLCGVIGKDDKPMNKRTGFCLETQFYPDTPNNHDFPQCFYDAGEEYCSVTEFAFSL